MSAGGEMHYVWSCWAAERMPQWGWGGGSANDNRQRWHDGRESSRYIDVQNARWRTTPRSGTNARCPLPLSLVLTILRTMDAGAWIAKRRGEYNWYILFTTTNFITVVDIAFFELLAHDVDDGKPAFSDLLLLGSKEYDVVLCKEVLSYYATLNRSWNLVWAFSFLLYIHRCTVSNRRFRSLSIPNKNI